jgi:hypothetical protein
MIGLNAFHIAKCCIQMGMKDLTKDYLKKAVEYAGEVNIT